MPFASVIPKPQQPNSSAAWIWFMYTGFLFIDPFFDRTVLCWSVTLASFVLFIGIYAAYVHSVDCQSKLRFWMIGATFILGMALFPFNGGASTFFIYAAAFLPFNIAPLRRVLLIFFSEMAIVLFEGAFFSAQHGVLHVSWPNTIIAVFLMVMIGGANIFFAEQMHFNRAQAKAQRDLLHAQAENLALAAVAERERIARDLHDVLGHTLSVIVLKAELANRLLTATTPNCDRAATEVADIERITRTALSEVREAIGGYRARGLAAEIEAARLTLDAAGVTLQL
ncbi:MAG: histidine kinase dimerization/phosphoacceptor domain-containing protein, partial [Acidobacteriaceae bacterium]